MKFVGIEYRRGGIVEAVCGLGLTHVGEGKKQKGLSLRLTGDCMVFGLWRVRFPPCLVRPGRRLPVQGLSEGSLGFLDRLPAWRARDRVEALSPGLPEIKEKSGI